MQYQPYRRERNDRGDRSGYEGGYRDRSSFGNRGGRGGYNRRDDQRVPNFDPRRVYNQPPGPTRGGGQVTSSYRPSYKQNGQRGDNYRSDGGRFQRYDDRRGSGRDSYQPQRRGYESGFGGRGRGRGGRRPEHKVTAEKLDQDMEKYWKEQGNEKAVENVQRLNQEQKEAKLAKERSELDAEMDSWKKKQQGETSE